MMSNDDQYYKSMYHTMFYAAETVCNWLTDGKDPIWAAEILMQAMRECEEIYISEAIPTPEQRSLQRRQAEEFLQEKGKS